MGILDLGNRAESTYDESKSYLLYVELEYLGEDMSRVKHHQSTGKGHTSFGMSRQGTQPKSSPGLRPPRAFGLGQRSTLASQEKSRSCMLEMRQCL